MNLQDLREAAADVYALFVDASDTYFAADKAFALATGSDDPQFLRATALAAEASSLRIEAVAAYRELTQKA